MAVLVNGLTGDNWSWTNPANPNGRRLIFDIESDGLLKAIPSRNIRQNTQVWCIGAIDVDTEEEFYWGVDQGNLAEAYEALSTATLALAHNGIAYDYPALEMLVPGWKRPAKAWDTMVTAKVIWPYDVLFGPDLALASKLGMSPAEKARFIKSHSLKAWGIRTGTHKQDYQGGFDAWSPSMAHYLMDDCRATLALWRLIEKRTGPGSSLEWPQRVFEVENEAARIIFEQTQAGCRFDRDEAVKLSADLTNAQAGLEAQLVETFGEWWQAGAITTPAIARSVAMPEFPDVTIRRVSEKTGKELKPYVGPPRCHFSPDAPYTPVERVRFNPGSRDHLGQRLQAVFGWKPKKFGTNGKPTVDESVLEEIPEAVMPEAVRKLILNYFVVTKTLGMVAKGSKSWLGLCTDDSRIHGELDPSGAVTGRGTHRNPNVSQVPATKKKKVVNEDGTKQEVVLHGLEGKYGHECRALWTADDGWEQTGVDASSLELILLGHYLHPLDGGAFAARVCDPSRDPHQENADIAGVTRADAKTTIYLKVYGGSAYKLSLDPALVVTPEEVPELLGYRGLPMILKNLEKRFDADFVAKLDDMQKARIAKARQVIVKLDEGIEGLKDLMDDVKNAAARGWLKGFDGRKVHVRKAHAALNALLQSAGAQAVKLWMVLLHRSLAEAGYVKGRDFKQTMWNHDEFQFTHKPGLGPIIKEHAERTIKETGRLLGLRGEFRSDAKTGANWAECH